MKTFGQQLGRLPTTAYSGDRRTRATGTLNPDAPTDATVWEISGIPQAVLPDLQPGIGHLELAVDLGDVIRLALAAGFFDAHGVDRATPVDARAALEVSLCFCEAGLLSPIWRVFAPQLGPDGPVDPKARRPNPSGIAAAKHLNRHAWEAFSEADREAHGYGGPEGWRRYYSDVMASLRTDVERGVLNPAETNMSTPGYENVLVSLPQALEWEERARAPIVVGASPSLLSEPAIRGKYGDRLRAVLQKTEATGAFSDAGRRELRHLANVIDADALMDLEEALTAREGQE